MTILVTGGCGFIGSNFILDWLAGRDERVINLDRLTYAANPANLKAAEGRPGYGFVHASIGEGDRVLALLREHRVRAILNFAAETHVDRSIQGSAPFIETNVVGTHRLLDAALAYWTELEPMARAGFRFLHVSTDEVYGTLGPDDPPFTEATGYRPNSPYAASKAAADHLVRAFGVTYGLPVLTTNCSNNFGPMQFPEKLIPLVIHHALAGFDLPIYGDGRQVRDWLYVADHCRAVARVLEAGRPGEAYNIGGDSERQNIEVVRAVCALLDAERPRADHRSYAEQITFVRDRPGHDRRYAIDAQKIHDELGWAPAESFESGLAKTVRWYLDNADWVARVTSGSYRDWLAQQYS